MGKLENRIKCEKCEYRKRVGSFNDGVCTKKLKEIAIYFAGRLPCEGISPIEKPFDLASH